MKITFLGHSCFTIESSASKILFDPAMSYVGTPDVNAEDMNPDILVISHGHGDHIFDAESIAKRTKCKVVSNFEIIMWLQAKGVENGFPMNYGGTHTFDDVGIKMVTATHSSELPDGKNGGNPGGFVVKNHEKSIYYAGDTGLNYDMKLLGEYENITTAILPIGDIFTMGVKDAIRASDMVKCNKVIGMHYNTFPPITIDTDEAINEFNLAGKELILLNINETLEI